jgi:hypothetical protein
LTDLSSNDRAFFFFYWNQSEDVLICEKLSDELNISLFIFQGAGRKIPGGATLIFQVEMIAFL